MFHPAATVTTAAEGIAAASDGPFTKTTDSHRKYTGDNINSVHLCARMLQCRKFGQDPSNTFKDNVCSGHTRGCTNRTNTLCAAALREAEA